MSAKSNQATNLATTSSDHSPQRLLEQARQDEDKNDNFKSPGLLSRPEERLLNALFGRRKPSVRTTFTVALSIIAASFAMTALTGCDNSTPTKVEDTKKDATDHNQAKFDHANETDAALLVTAAEINLKEIHLGQLAQSNSTTKEVKALGKMMQEDHEKAMKDLQMLAAKKQISLPASLTNNGQDAANQIKDKNGMVFDKTYCNMMVDGHKDAVTKYEKTSTDASDPDIKAWAVGMLPTLRMHLDHAITCQKNCAKM